MKKIETYIDWDYDYVKMYIIKNAVRIYTNMLEMVLLCRWYFGCLLTFGNICMMII